jgi:outer membrane protein
MKRLSVFALTLALASTAMAAAQSTAAAPKPAAPAGPTKVAVVAFQVALAQTNEFQRDLADLQKKYDPKKTQLKALNDEIENLTKQLQSSSAQLSDAERVNRTRTLDEKKKQLERESQDAQSDFQADMQQLIGKMANKVGAVMTDYAEKNGFTLVLDAISPRRSSTPTTRSQVYRLRRRSRPPWMRRNLHPRTNLLRMKAEGRFVAALGLSTLTLPIAPPIIPLVSAEHSICILFQLCAIRRGNFRANRKEDEPGGFVRRQRFVLASKPRKLKE